ncbi:MAG: hypothetical protein WCF23_16880, partial [Candidatus Nitrosopolaris sp.]
YSAGKSDPTMPTIEVLVNMLEEREAKVAAPPKIIVSVLKGVRVVSKAIVPNTVNICMQKLTHSKLINFKKNKLPRKVGIQKIAPKT